MTHDASGDRIPISAVLITRDAERHLDRVLQPLSVCSEILVMDSGSVDRTRDIAVAHGAVWHEHPFDGYGPQKRRAVVLAAHDWILSVDADEVLDRDAVTNLAAVSWLDQDPSSCWAITRRPFVGDREIRHGHWVPDRVVRVFNRLVHNISEDRLHESVHPTGAVHALGGSLLHYSYADLAELFPAEYFRLKAEALRARGMRSRGPAIAARAIAAFVKSYVLRRGFLDGGAGVVVALAGAAHAAVGLAIASEQVPTARAGLDDRTSRP